MYFCKELLQVLQSDKCNLDNWIFADRGILMMPSDCTVDKFLRLESMKIWERLIRGIKAEEKNGIFSKKTASDTYNNAPRYAVIDTEIGLSDHKVHDIGALRHDGGVFHKSSKSELLGFLKDVDYLCGHNIIHHDIKYLFEDEPCPWILVDTLYVSPLLFPERPYHRLVKDDKLVSDQMNNPVNDCEKARDLLMDEVAQWNSLSEEKRIMFASLLKDKREFEGFFKMVGATAVDDRPADLVRSIYKGMICGHADLDMMIRQYPCELAYALALIDTTDHRSVTPGWVLKNYPAVEFVMKLLRETSCSEGCDYCNTKLNVRYILKTFFGYDGFRTYDGVPLQEQAAKAAIDGKSLLAISSHRRRQVAYVSVAGTDAGPFRSWTDCSNFAFAVADERPGGQSC